MPQPSARGYAAASTANRLLRPDDQKPEHERWASHWVADHLYTLDELTFWMTGTGFMPPPSWKRTHRKNPVGLGRNCALFESARAWAYREIRHHFGDHDGLGRTIQTAAQAMNQEQFADPLAVREVDQIARSIHRWIITRSRMWADDPAVYEAIFSTIQSSRIQKRWSKESTKTKQRLERL